MITSHIIDNHKEYIKALKLKINKDEVAELTAQGVSSRYALKQSIKNSLISWSFKDPKGKVIAVAGISKYEYDAGIGVVWILANECLMAKYTKSATLIALEALEFAFNTLNLYCLCNYVSVSNTKSIRWLKYLGFEFMDTYKLFKDKKVYFKEFYMYKEDYLKCV